MGSVSTFSVGETTELIPLPPGTTQVVVLNSSEGIGDRPGAPDIIADDNSSCSADPQIGWRIRPGELCCVPLRSGKLYAVASGPGATITIELPEHEPEED
jgi:hypothetical protein